MWIDLPNLLSLSPRLPQFIPARDEVRNSYPLPYRETMVLRRTSDRTEITEKPQFCHRRKTSSPSWGEEEEEEQEEEEEEEEEELPHY